LKGHHHWRSPLRSLEPTSVEMGLFAVRGVEVFGASLPG
jgi:hypothetical protein